MERKTSTSLPLTAPTEAIMPAIWSCSRLSERTTTLIRFDAMVAPSGRARRRLGDRLQRGGRNELAVQAGVPCAPAVGHRHELAVIDYRHPQLRAVPPVDLLLVDLDVRLAERAGRHDHVRAVVVRRFDDRPDLGLALFRLREGEGAPAARDLLVVVRERLGAHG